MFLEEEPLLKNLFVLGSEEPSRNREQSERGGWDRVPIRPSALSIQESHDRTIEPMKSIKILACGVVGSALSLTAPAAPVPIVNPSFETPPLAADGNSSLAAAKPGGTFEGWSYFMTTGSSFQDFGIENPGGGSYTDAENAGIPLGGDGINVAFLNQGINGGVINIFQDVGALQPNTTYALTAAIGQRNDRVNGSATIGLLSAAPGETNVWANGTPLNSVTGVSSVSGELQDFQVSFSTGDTVTGNLYIGAQYTGDGTIQAAVDHFRLEAVAGARDPWFDVTDVTTNAPSGPSTISIPVSNLGMSEPLDIVSVSISGFDADFFSLPGSFPQDIAPGTTGTINLNFDPQGIEGDFEVDLEIGSNDNIFPNKSIHLLVSVAQPDAVYNTSLGSVPNTGGLQTYQLQVTNNGTVDLEIYDAFLAETPAAPHYYQRFEVDFDFIADFITIPAGQSGSIPITFDPSGLAAGTKTARVSLQTNEFDNANPDLVVSIEVTGAIDDGPTSLVHRWSFDDVSDSVGSADVELIGSATVEAGNLNLPGVGVRLDYAKVPIGETLATSNSVSVESWFTIGEAAQAWRKLWMFGSGQSNVDQSVWMDFTPYTGDPVGIPSLSIKSPASQPTTRGDANPAELSVGEEHHAVAVFDADDQSIRLYIDGALADSVAWPSAVHDLGITDDNQIGAAVFFGDTDWKGTINEMRIWKGALSSADISASFSGGPSNVIEPGVAPPEPLGIGSVVIVDGTLTLTAQGLQPGVQYHLETGTTLDDFAALPGSTFTAGDPVPAIPVDGPRRFARIAEGPAPTP